MMFQYHLHTNLHLSSEKQNICLTALKGTGRGRARVKHLLIDDLKMTHWISVMLFFSSSVFQNKIRTVNHLDIFVS